MIPFLNPDDYARLVAADRRRRERAVAAAAGVIRSRCGHCWTPLHLTGYSAPGGLLVTLTRCPVCDSYRLEDDR